MEVYLAHDSENFNVRVLMFYEGFHASSHAKGGRAREHQRTNEQEEAELNFVTSPLS
jgi:hypothetical protein